MVNPTTTSTLSPVYVRFPIPSTLSTKYNIYCVFVPNYLENNLDKRPFKLSFYISYKGITGEEQLVVANNTTDTTYITKMLIASNFKFPYSHISPLESANDIVKIKVKTEVRAGKTYEAVNSRSFLLDYILLEPVNE
jgi:hypothetical protein